MLIRRLFCLVCAVVLGTTTVCAQRSAPSPAPTFAWLAPASGSLSLHDASAMETPPVAAPPFDIETTRRQRLQALREALRPTPPPDAALTDRLRPDADGDDAPSLPSELQPLQEARAALMDLTTYRTSRYLLRVDPLKMRCVLRFRVARLAELF